LLIWFSSTNHREIASLYFWLSLAIGFIAFFYSVIMRLSLIWPYSFCCNGDLYLNFVTLHAIFMIFFFIMPFSIGGLVNYMLPLYLNCADMVCPRLNNLSFWLLFFALMLSFCSTIFAKGVFSGWTMYPPLSSYPYSSSISGDFLIFSLHFAGVSSIMSSINFLVTIFSFSSLDIGQWPLFIIAQTTVAFLLVISLPVLAAAITMLLFDRNFSTGFFSNVTSGDAILYQHLFWFFGHPEVYVLILPAFALLSNTLCFLGNSKMPFGYLGLSIAIIAIGLMGCIVWAHHMFTSGMDLDTRVYFSFATLIIGVPTGIKIFSWLYNFYSCQLIYTPLYIWVLGFIFLFSIGGFSGIVLANCHINAFFHDTYYVIAHFHYVLSLGAVMGVWLSLFLYFPFFFKITSSYFTQMVCFGTFFFGANLLFFPLHFLGFWGLPRHYMVYDPNFYCFSHLSLVGILLIFVSVIWFFAHVQFTDNVKCSFTYLHELPIKVCYYLKDNYFTCLKFKS